MKIKAIEWIIVVIFFETRFFFLTFDSFVNNCEEMMKEGIYFTYYLCIVYLFLRA